MAKRTSRDEKNEQVDDVGTGTHSASTTKPVAIMEMIDGFSVHPAASVMPTMPENQFMDLVESIAKHGLGDPIEFKDDLLVEGRHRLKAIVLLRERGTMVEVRKAAWQPFPDETVAEYVKRKNLHRRHMTDSQRLQCAAALLVMSDEERAADGRIQPGEVRNPAGANQYTPPDATLEGETDSTPAIDRRARNKAKTDRSAAGRLAKTSGQTVHKARQAIAVQKNGTPEEIAAVTSGEKTQPQVLKEIAARTGKQADKKKPKPPQHPYTPTTDLERELLTGWVLLRDDKVAVTERAEAREAMRAILKAEEQADAATSRSSKGGAK
jgi:hypothetical protein